MIGINRQSLEYIRIRKGNNMADILSKISIVFYVLSGLLFLLSILFWVRFRIPNIIGELSGRNAKKSIRQTGTRSDSKPERKFEPKPKEESKQQLPIAAESMLTEPLLQRGESLKTEAPAKENITIPLHSGKRDTAYPQGEEMEIIEEFLSTNTNEKI